MRMERTHTEDETIELGGRIAAELPPRAVVLLIGNLGAGKTTMAKGILQGLGVAKLEDVTSPTFTLIHEYESASRLAYHIDLYRLDEARQVAGLGLDEIFDREAIVLIEWGERFPELLPARRLEIRLESTSDDQRNVQLQWLG
ncbi:MAG: tRNA (adenosine(37)-N6)-threonylcarbamoyltransferase complex ATPase subunit type 1 TsaE [Acidobacteriota bacterium]